MFGKGTVATVSQEVTVTTELRRVCERDKVHKVAVADLGDKTAWGGGFKG